MTVSNQKTGSKIVEMFGGSFDNALFGDVPVSVLASANFVYDGETMDFATFKTYACEDELVYFS